MTKEENENEEKNDLPILTHGNHHDAALPRGQKLAVLFLGAVP
jgi:hypothetical protein